MKPYSLILFLLLSFICFNSQAQGKITVEVSNFKSTKGVTRICLYNNATAFNGEGQPVQCFAAAVKNNKATAVFENVPAGTYAVSLFHDVNNNNKMDVNFVGIPKEGYGASKNKLPFASAPTFADNKFDVGANNTINIEIRLRNL